MLDLMMYFYFSFCPKWVRIATHFGKYPAGILIVRPRYARPYGELRVRTRRYARTMIHSEVVTKIDAAVRQLNCAVELFFENGDPVPIHTLVCAAHLIVHDINRAQGGR